MAGKRKTVKSGTTTETTQSAAAPKATKAAKPAAAKPRATKKAAPEVVMTVSHDQIARRAYEIWLAKGCPQGADYQNWVEAEAELKA